LGKKGTDMLIGFMRRTVAGRDVKVHVFQDLVHEALDILGSLHQAEGYKAKFKKPRGL
jgi:hypothetical protein